MTVKKQGAAGERAKRLLYLRKEVLRLTREKFAKASGLPANTLKNWEQGRNRGLTEEGATKLVEAYRREGIDCTIEWLFYGVGEKPTSTYVTTKIAPSAEDKLILQELALFQKHTKVILETCLTDDSMSPYLCRGDHVAGKRYVGAAMHKAIGLPSIVELVGGQLLVRLVEIGDKPDCYNLVCANPTMNLQNSMQNVQLSCVAPILWIRRRSFS